MSRPPINYSEVVLGPYQVDVYRPNGSHDPTYHYTRTIGSVVVYKPESVSTPRIQPRPPTSFQSYKMIQIRSPVGVLTRSHDSGLRVVETGFAASPDGLGPNPFQTYLADKALSSALLQLREGTVNLGVALAEAQATGGHLANTVRRIARSVEEFRRRKGKKTWDRVKREGVHSVPQSWLELQYGWNPLMNDILGSCIAVDEAWNKPQAPNIRVSGFASDTLLHRVDPEYAGNDPRFGWNGTEEQIAEVVLYYSLKSYFRQMVSELGLVNPLEIIWERMPYSFVVDWFLPLGDWFAGLSADTGWDFVHGKLSTYQTLNAQTVNPSAEWRNGSVGIQWRPLRPGIQNGYQFSRSVYGGSPTPRVVLQNPLKRLGLTRVTSGLALLSQAFR